MYRDGSLQRFGLPDHHSFAAHAYNVSARGSKFTLSKTKTPNPESPAKPSTRKAAALSCSRQTKNADSKRSAGRLSRFTASIYSKEAGRPSIRYTRKKNRVTLSTHPFVVQPFWVTVSVVLEQG
jgi:hypothetical protein